MFASLAQRSFNESSLRPASWAALKPATLKAKAKKGRSSNILQATGALKASPKVGVVNAAAGTVQVGTDRPYGQFHQLGTKHLPARPFFPVDKSGNLTPRARQLVQLAAQKALDTELRN
jgi:phage gpG-like protein